MNIKSLICAMIVGVFVTTAEAVENLPGQLSACISLKTPGNNSRQYPLTFLESASGKGCFSLKASQELAIGNHGACQKPK